MILTKSQANKKNSQSAKKQLFFIGEFAKIIRLNIGVSPSGKATDSDSVIREFESLHPSHQQSLLPLRKGLCFFLRKKQKPFSILQSLCSLFTGSHLRNNVTLRYSVAPLLANLSTPANSKARFCANTPKSLGVFDFLSALPLSQKSFAFAKSFREPFFIFCLYAKGFFVRSLVKI